MSSVVIIFSSSYGQTANQEFRATWVITWEHINAGSNPEQNQARIRKILDDHQTANMNAVLFQVRQGGTAYYNSSFEPWGYYAGHNDPGYDPLAYAVEEAHKRGMELHAWFNVFQTSSTQPGTPAAEHPEWVCRDRDGNPMTGYRALSPGLDEVRQYTINVAMEIVRNYDIDGLHLDYVRWNEYSSTGTLLKSVSQIDEIRVLDGRITEKQLDMLESNSAGRYLYDVDHPHSAGVPSGFNSWEEWWRWSVTQFVSVLHDSIQSLKPHVRLSAAVLGKYNWSGWQAYGTVYQDAALWFNEGYVDQLTPMHYHWLTGSEFYGMLASGSSQSWEPYIQPGITAGRLFTIGPGSYMLDEYDVWGNHPSIVKRSRSVSWTDGFQFFSYGSWEGYKYWEEAGNTFFRRKSKIRATGLIDSVPPDPPTINLVKNDSLEYQLTVQPPSSIDADQWFIIYRSTDGNISISEDDIIDIQFGTSPNSVLDQFPGTQNFDGSYTYAATSLDRFWNESEISNTVRTDPIPSFAPKIMTTFPVSGDTVPIQSDITIIFSKSMDSTSLAGAVTVVPLIQVEKMLWTDTYKTLTLDLAENLLPDTDYTVGISAEALDINGRALDGNGDGISGDPFQFQFTTLVVDILGPEIILTYPNPDPGWMDLDDVMTIVFNEWIDPTTISEETIYLINAGRKVSIEPLLTHQRDRSLLNIKSYSELESNADNTLTIASVIADTAGNPIGHNVELQFQTEEYFYSQKTTLDDFMGAGDWWAPWGSGSTIGIIQPGSGFGYSTSNYLPASGFNPSERKSGYISYQWDPSADSHLLREHIGNSAPAIVTFDTTYILQCYVYGDGSNNLLRFSLYEQGPNTAEVSRWIPLNWVGWRLMEWDLGDPASVGSWIGNGIMDGTTYTFESFQLAWADQGAESGKIFVDNLRLVKRSSGQQAPNHSPVATHIPDTTTTQGTRVKIYVYYDDPDPGDIHRITAFSDTSAFTFRVLGSNPGTRVYITPWDSFIGDATIGIIVTDLGIGELADTAYFTLSVTPDLAIDDPGVPLEFGLSQNFPNPFNSRTTFLFTLPSTGKVELILFDLLGREVNTLVRKQLPAGQHTVEWQGRNQRGKLVPSGTYFYQLRAPGFIDTKRLLYLK